MLTESIIGYPISTIPIDRCIDQIRQSLEVDRRPMVFCCANPHSLVQAEADLAFKQALFDADLLTPDGIGIVLASKILSGCINERVTGSDIFYGLSSALDAAGGRSYFFLGSTVNTLAVIEKKIKRDYPNIGFAGSYSPPFKREFSEKDSRIMVEKINLVGPDILWVGMTAPKQEKWIYRNRDRINVKFIGAIGAVFDFYAGNIRRSHPFFQKYGLEWFPRFLQEPKRLFRRNFISSPLFLFLVIRQMLKK